MTPADTQPDLRHLVLVGGGHAQVSVLRGLAMDPLPGLRVTLVSRDTLTPYSGMLPGYFEGLYRHDEITIDLSHLARFAGARFVAAEVTGVDAAARTVSVAGRPPMAFDVLSLNIGSNTDLGRIEGAAEHAIPVKPISTLLGRLGPALEAGRSRSMAVVGGGAAGVECALALRQRHPDTPITLVQKGARLVPEYPAAASARLVATLEARSIAVHTGRAVARVGAGGLTLEDGAELEAGLTLVVTPGAPPAWLRETGLPLDDRGFVRVAPTLEVEGADGVFAAGDIASLTADPRPKAGVFAVRAGRHLAANIRRKLLGERLRRWRPQRRYLALVGTGGRRAMAVRGGMSLDLGRLGWVWKEHIDRKFMDRFSDLPAMPPPDPSPLAGDVDGGDDPAHAAMRCKGCGAKLGFDALRGALDQAAGNLAGIHPNAPAGPGALEDSSRLPLGGGVVVQSVDALTAIVDDPFLLGRIAALHALSDIHASHARPLAALAMLTLPPAAARLQQDDAGQIMAGAELALAEEGARVSGGHTAEGPAMQVGFAVTGEALDGGAPAPPADGDARVLTKPLGVGIVMAAHGAGCRLADGECRNRAIAVMSRSNRHAAALLGRHGRFALTEVTGFGLARHTRSLLERPGRGQSAVFDPAALPLIRGVRALLEAGFESSLAGMNRAAAPLHGGPTGVDGVLHDPQTGGGLLAAVPARHLEAVLAGAEAGGQTFAVVGRVVEDGLGQIRLAT